MEVILFGPNIEYDLSLPRLLAIGLRDHDSSATARHRVAQPQKIDKQLASIARNQWKSRYISIYEDLCTPSAGSESEVNYAESSGCPVYVASGVPLLFDTDHLTPEVSIAYAEAMRTRGQLG